MGDLADRIAEAKKKVEDLRKQLGKTKAAKKEGFDSLKDFAADRALPLVPSLKVRRTLKGHFGKVYAMHWAGNNKELVSASQDGKLIVWDAQTTIKAQAIPLRSSWVMTCAFEQSKNMFVACGGLDNMCSIYKLDRPQVMRTHCELAAHDGYLSCCRFVQESHILTSSGDSTCMYWDIEQGTPLQTFKDHEGDVMSVSILPGVDPNTFVSGSCDTTAKVWDIRTGKCTMTLRGHESDINSISLFGDGKSFGTGSDDSTCRYFDMRACSEVCEFKNDMVLCGITSVSFSHSGRLLFAGYDDYNCFGWDLLGRTDKPAFTLTPTHDNRVSSVGVSPNGQAVCTGSWDQTLRVWA